jgi:hypothetical protein
VIILAAVVLFAIDLMGIPFGNNPETKTWQYGAQELAKLREHRTLEPGDRVRRSLRIGR